MFKRRAEFNGFRRFFLRTRRIALLKWRLDLCSGDQASGKREQAGREVSSAKNLFSLKNSLTHTRTHIFLGVSIAAAAAAAAARIHVVAMAALALIERS